MGDLEDKFLKQNVPGRYSSWNDDATDDKISALRHQDEQDSCCNNSDDDGSEDDEFYFNDIPPTAQQQTTMPLRPTGNTGVKGVIADYKEAQREEQLQKAEEELDNMQRLQRATQPSIRPRDTAANEMKKQHQGNDSDDDDDDDDEFLKQFRMQRIAQLQKSNAMPTFGTLSSKSPEDYVELVDDMDPRVFVIVHLFEPSMATSRMLHSALDKVAQTMEYANFIEVNALEANPNLDLICLPAILIYKGGKLVNNMIKFTDGLPKAFTVGDVKEALEVAGVV
ncbi:phosducin-like protein [Skeletonema marinoi]|uniref:Phosducin-like protein n=1 Tax=Skeletonema marinoi TaxID=267567 RepID=A0AAD8Y453_9STRA|nr:phosducin-like protein [Skeletonema marinoi]